MIKTLNSRLLVGTLATAFAVVVGAWLAQSGKDVSQIAYSIVAPVLALGTLSVIVHRLLLAPLRQLSEATSELRLNGDTLPDSLPLGRQDELGALARELALLAGARNASADGLSENRKRLDSLVDAIPDALLRFDRSGNILDARLPKDFRTILSTDTIVGHQLQDVLPGPVAQLYLDAAEKVYLNGHAECFEHDLRLEKSQPSLGLEIRLVHSGDQEFLAIIRDITKEKQVAASQARLANILDATPDAVITIEADGTVRYINPAAMALLGTGSESSNLFQDGCVPDWVRTQLLETSMLEAESNGVWRGPSALVDRESGSEIPISLTLLPHLRSEGNSHDFSFIATDLRQLKKAGTDHMFAEQDPITGLASRRKFVEELERELARSRQFDAHGAVLLMDLDDFKYINDSLGHRAGDQLLSSLSEVLRGALRSNDLLARLGGDEFAVLFLGQSREEIEIVAQRLTQAVRKHSLLIGDQPMGVTASIGVAIFPDHGTTVEEVLSHADQAMYQAKEKGRDRYLFFTYNEAWQAGVDSRLSGEKLIRQALDNDDFVLHAQPILDLASGEITHYEVLIRMRAPNGEIMLPAAFLSTAERFGLIRSVDRWVVQTAIRIIGEHQRAGHDVRLSVNLSGKSLGDPELLPLVIAELSANRVNPSNLTFEITETAVIADTERAQTFATSMKQIGCGLALDDFGVGFSSLNQLRHLPIDFLKIDGSFIRELPDNIVDQHLVDAIVGMARALSKKTVAEFVGDDRTQEMLRLAGVDYAQGFHIGKPMAVELAIPVPTLLPEKQH